MYSDVKFSSVDDSSGSSYSRAGRAAAPKAAGQYAGSGKLRKCHPKQYSEQSKSGHARSLSLAREHALASRFPGSPGEWAFGAGDQAVTFVSRVDDEFYVEHGLSYYTRSNALALTPGHIECGGTVSNV